MNSRQPINRVMLLYFYGAVIIIFIVLGIAFNTAGQIQTHNMLQLRLEEVKEQVRVFQTEIDEPGGPRRRVMFRQRMLRFSDSPVHVIFVGPDRNLSLPLAKATDPTADVNRPVTAPVTGASTPMGEGMGMGMGQGQGRGQGMMGYYMSLEPSIYKDAKRVAEYLVQSQYDLDNDETKRIQLDHTNYMIRAIPFSQDQAQPEYVVAYISMAHYDEFSQKAFLILAGIMLPLLILAFFLIGLLADSFSKPVKKLQGLSRRLGDGEFEGEDFNFSALELNELNRSLNDTAKKLKTYHDNQKVFFQNASHELRTPLTSIQGYAEGILYGVFDAETAAEVIKTESVKLEKLVDNILYLSRIESNESLLEEETRISLKDLLLSSREQVLAEAEILKKKVEVQCSDNPLIRVYFEEMERALVNLLSNGLRYAKETVIIRGELLKDALLISVADDGPGIEPGKEEAIFRRFHKGNQGNHGIGLSISSAAIARQGGTISAVNRPQGGALFSIRLPLDLLVEDENDQEVEPEA